MDLRMIRASLQACALSGLSNVLGQLIACYQSDRPFTISPVQLAHFMLFSLMACPPNYLWQNWLEAHFPAYTDTPSNAEQDKLGADTGTGSTSSASVNGSVDLRSGASNTEKDKAAIAPLTSSRPPPKSTKLNLRNTVIKFSLDQTFGAAANTIMFIVGIALLRGHSLDSVQADVRDKFWPMIFAGQKLWPLVSVLSFTLVPLEHRTLFGSVVGLFWGVYLSLISGERKK